MEDRLGRVLSGLASTTAVSPDGWDRIEARTSSRRRLPGAVRFGVPALAVALVVALLAVVLRRGDDRPSVGADPAPEPRAATARFAPQGLSAYTLESAGTSGGVPAPGDASPVRVYGHRTDGGVRLDAVVLVVTARSEQDAELLRTTETGDPPPSPLCTTSWPTGCLGAPVGELTAGGQASAIMAIEGGFKVAWEEPGGPTVALLTRGVPQEALATVVEGIRLDGGTAVAEALPNGYIEVHRGIWPAQPETMATYVASSRGPRRTPTTASPW